MSSTNPGQTESEAAQGQETKVAESSTSQNTSTPIEDGKISPLGGVLVSETLTEVAGKGGANTSPFDGKDKLGVVKYEIGDQLGGPALFSLVKEETGEEVFTNSVSGGESGTILTVLDAEKYRFHLETYGNDEVEWAFSLLTIDKSGKIGLPSQFEGDMPRTIGPLKADGDVSVTMAAQNSAESEASITVHGFDGGILGGFETQPGQEKTEVFSSDSGLFFQVGGPGWVVNLE